LKNSLGTPPLTRTPVRARQTPIVAIVGVLVADALKSNPTVRIEALGALDSNPGEQIVKASPPLELVAVNLALISLQRRGVNVNIGDFAIERSCRDGASVVFATGYPPVWLCATGKVG